MKLLRSLRARLLLGSVLWTVGMLPIAHLLSISLIIRFPAAAGVPRVIFIHRPDHGGPVLLTALVHYSGFLAIAVVFMAAGFLLVRSGLSPMRELRSRLSAVHKGLERRVEGSYPTEVQPLVDDLNQLLEHREETVRRAIAKAGDLAHGLKTPLAVLAQEAALARAAGNMQLSCAIAEQVERMRRQMDFHLAHARAAASGAAPGTRSSVLASVGGLARTLERLHADRGISIELHIPGDDWVRVQREDLDEMIGNLLDNACKWARAHVVVSADTRNDAVTLLLDDDGPGIAPSLRELVLQRGVRADEAAAGSGFGLAIVRDVAEVYGGSIALEDSPMGGLRARLQLPRT